MELLLAEELLLLGLDEESGKATWSFDASVLHGALLLDLVDAGAVEITDKVVVPAPEAPAHPLLAEAHRVITESSKRRTVQDWHSRLPWALRPLQTLVAQRLVADGVLEEREDKVLGLFRTTRLPEADPGPEQALRARLRTILVDGREPDDHDTLLVTLLDAAAGALFADEEKEVRKLARKRASEIAKRFRDDPVLTAGRDAAVAAAVSTVVMAGVVSAPACGDGGAGGACST